MYTIYFDMDGTIADLYNVENWLPKLRAEDASPYIEAEIMVDASELQLYHFDEMHIVKYGTRKDYVAKDKNGILFDDSEEVRKNWRGIPVNPNTENIIEFLKMVKELTE